jgi:hypothetical protein
MFNKNGNQFLNLIKITGLCFHLRGYRITFVLAVGTAIAAIVATALGSSVIGITLALITLGAMIWPILFSILLIPLALAGTVEKFIRG